MSAPFVGEIRMFGGNFAPVGWMLCQGQLLPISENPTLFQLIGTTYGGDGQTNFALPNLASRLPIHVGPGFALGQPGGAETVTLNVTQIPAHSHVPASVTGGGNPKSTPGNNFLADDILANAPNPVPFAYTGYVNNANQRNLNSKTIGNTGGSQPHDNMIPFLAINFIISLFGVFPSQS
jgi:microcystin-dependent protein